MRGRRHKLAVSTFPFLAVLLCAMGSLILILLVMDRKAHQAVQARARREAARLVEQSAQTEAAQRAELEKKQQQARTAWEQKRDALHANLTREQTELQIQMRKVRDQFSQIAARLRYEQDTSTELRHKVQDERGRIQAEQRLLATLRSKAGQSEEQSKESSKTVRRMTLDLLQMEQALKDLKAAKKREQHTFSVIPYHGRRGENRQPIYVECTAEGVIFHPERRAMPVTAREVLVGRNQPGDAPDDVRSEVERRIARQHAKKAGSASAANTTPYLLLLVRPDGIHNYLALQAVLRDLTDDKENPLQFGYEFIDADWVLDFPTDEDQPNAQPWMATTKTPSATPSAAPIRTGSSVRPVAIPAQSEPGVMANSVVGSFRFGTGSGSATASRNPAGGAGAGASGTGSRLGGAGPSVPGGVAGGSTSTAAGGAKFLGSSDGRPGGVGGGNSLNSESGLAVGAGSGGTNPSGGFSNNLGGSGNGSGSPLASSGIGGGETGRGGMSTSSGRGGGTGGNSLAMPHPPGSTEGEPGRTSGGAFGTNGGSRGASVLGGAGRSTGTGSPTSGSPGEFGSEVAGLGPPRALGSGSSGAGGYSGGSGPAGSGGAGSNVPGAPGGSNTGYPGNGGTGVASSQAAGLGATGDGGSGNGIPGSGAPGSGGSGNGVAGNGSPGTNSSGSPIPPGTSAEGGYSVARGNGGSGSGLPGGSGGTSTGMPGGTSSGQPGNSGAAGSAAGSPGVPGQSSSGTSEARGQGGSGGQSAGTPGAPSSGQPGTSGGASGNASRTSQGDDGSAFPAVDPLLPRSSSGSRPGEGAAAGQRPPRRSEDAEYEAVPRKRRLVNGGGGGSDEPSDSASASNRFAPPSAPSRRPRKPAALRPAWVHGGRDWTIYIECRADAVVLYPSEKSFPLAQAAGEASINPLVAEIRKMIARRQSGLRPGDPPFYPQIRLLVRSENVRTFLMVYPALEALPVPKTRQNLDPDDDILDIVQGVNP